MTGAVFQSNKPFSRRAMEGTRGVTQRRGSSSIHRPSLVPTGVS